MNPLEKLNKLKRFSAYVSDKIRETITVFDANEPVTQTTAINPLENEINEIDCLNNGDIYTKRDMWERLDAIAECASLVELRRYDDGEVVFHNANFCHNPVVCPMCADRVSKRRRSIFSDPIKRAVRKFGVEPGCGDWKDEYPRDYTGVYLATATIKDGPNLRNRIDTLIDSIRRMRKMGQKRGDKRSGGEWSKIKAGLSSVEIKIGSGSGEWHVHAHFLIFTDTPIDYRIRDSAFKIPIGGELVNVSKFNYEWYEATGGEGTIFDVAPIQFKKNIHGKECATFEESVERQAQEVLKYSTTLSKKKGAGLLEAAQYIELIQRRGNRRLFNSLGLLRCDKRNPESLTTVSERELKRLEYAEQSDKKCYEVLSSLWQSGGTYQEPQKQDGAIFKSSDDMKTRYIDVRRRAFQAQTAIYQGEYRRSRNGLLNGRENFSDKEYFENVLDECRDIFRNKVAELWKKINDMNFIPEFLTDFNRGGMEEFKKLHLKLLPTFCYYPDFVHST